MAAPSTPPALSRQQAPGERIGRRGAGRGVAGRHCARGGAGRRDGGREPRATDPLGGRPAAGGGAGRRRSALLPRRAARRHRGFGDRRLGALHTGPVRRPAGPDPAGPAAPPRTDAPGSGGRTVRWARMGPWSARRGDWLVLAGRLVPGLRAVVSVPAGMGRMPLWRFLLLTAIGSLVWNAALIGVGAALAARWAEVAAVVAPASAYLLAVSAALVPALWWLRRRWGVGAVAR